MKPGRGAPCRKKTPTAATNGTVPLGPTPPDGVESELTQRSKQLRAAGSDPAEAAQAVAGDIQQQVQQQQQAQGQAHVSFVADVQV